MESSAEEYTGWLPRKHDMQREINILRVVKAASQEKSC